MVTAKWEDTKLKMQEGNDVAFQGEIYEIGRHFHREGDFEWVPKLVNSKKLAFMLIPGF